MDRIQITQLKDEGVKEELRAPEVATMPSADVLSATTKEYRTHNVTDFLNRFHVLERFNWTINDARGAVLKTYTFPDALTSIASIRNKFLNFYGLRAGVQLIVQVNSQPFQAGNLLVSYLPNSRYNNSKRETHEAGLQGMVSRTGSPRVNLDLMDGTRVDMTVPYASPFVFYNLFTKDGNIGNFYISVYSKLSDVAAAGFVTVTVAARFVDVELAFPIGSNLPTSGTVAEIEEASEDLRIKPTREKVEVLRKRTEEILARLDAGELSFQSGNNTMVSAFKQKAVPNMATTDDSNMTHMMSIKKDNALVPLQMGDTSKDDMSFSEIWSIPCYHNAFSVSTTDASNANLWSARVGPLQLTDIVNTDSSLSVDYLYYLCNTFKKWRGSIKYKFRVVKTKYHSLRLRVSFAPGTTTQVGVDRDSCYSEIFDLRDNNTFEFTVPYVHPYPWLNSRGNGLTTTTSLGLIIVDVHNQMVAPSTVSSSIEVIVERCAGPDFEVAVPSSINSFPFNPITPTQEEKKRRVVDQPAPTTILKETEEVLEKPPQSVITRTYKNVPITYEFLGNMNNLSKEILGWLSGAVVRDPFRFQESYIAAMNQLAGLTEVTYDSFKKTLPQIIALIDSYASKHNIKIRSVEEGVIIETPVKFQSDERIKGMALKSSLKYFEAGSRAAMFVGYALNEIPWYYYFPGVALAQIVVGLSLQGFGLLADNLFKKDLTKEGIEPNPGPIHTTRSLITGTQVVNFTSPFFGRQLIRIQVGVAPTLNTIDSGDFSITSNAPNSYVNILPRCYTGAPFDTTFEWEERIIPILTVTGQNGTTTHECYVTVQFITGYFGFQGASFEQDTERGMTSLNSVTQPTIVTDMAKYCMGVSTCHVKDMIGRSTRLGGITTLDGRPIHIQSHGIGMSQKDDDGLLSVAGTDNITYFAHLYAFMRGGVGFRLQTTGNPYRVVVDVNNDINSGSTTTFDIIEQAGNNLTTSELVRVSNCMQHIIATAVEGIGEYSVPFYSSSYCISVAPQFSFDPTDEPPFFTMADTQVLILPSGSLSELVVFRHASSDFEFSYLTGPALLYPF